MSQVRPSPLLTDLTEQLMQVVRSELFPESALISLLATDEAANDCRWSRTTKRRAGTCCWFTMPCSVRDDPMLADFTEKSIAYNNDTRVPFAHFNAASAACRLSAIAVASVDGGWAAI
jgi:hypothetical protein